MWCTLKRQITGSPRCRCSLLMQLAHLLLLVATPANADCKDPPGLHCIAFVLRHTHVNHDDRFHFLCAAAFSWGESHLFGVLASVGASYLQCMQIRTHSQ